MLGYLKRLSIRSSGELVGVAGRFLQQGFGLLVSIWLAHAEGAATVGRYMFLIATLSFVIAPIYGGAQTLLVTNKELTGPLPSRLGLWITLLCAIFCAILAVAERGVAWASVGLVIVSQKVGELVFLHHVSETSVRGVFVRLISLGTLFLIFPFVIAGTEFYSTLFIVALTSLVPSFLELWVSSAGCQTCEINIQSLLRKYGSATFVVGLTQIPLVADAVLVRWAGGDEQVAAFRTACALILLPSPAIAILLSITAKKCLAHAMGFLDFVLRFRHLFALVLTYSTVSILWFRPVARLLYGDIDYTEIPIWAIGASYLLSTVTTTISFYLYRINRHNAVSALYAGALFVVYAGLFQFGVSVAAVVIAGLAFQCALLCGMVIYTSVICTCRDNAGNP